MTSPLNLCHYPQRKACHILILLSVDDGTSMVWTASLHEAPSESAVPTGTSLLSPQASLQVLDTLSKGKGHACSVSSAAPYDVSDPACIVKNPKASKAIPAKKAPKAKKAPSVSKHTIKESKAAKIIAQAVRAEPAARTTCSKAATHDTSLLSPHEEIPELKSEEITDLAVHTLCQTRCTVLAAAASLDTTLVAVPPKKKSVQDHSSSSLTSP